MGLKDAVRVGARRGLNVQRGAITCVAKRIRIAVTVTVTFRGSNITGRGSNRPVTPTPDPARPGGVGEHQRRAALRPPASSRPPNIGQMRVLNQVTLTFGTKL